MLLASAGTSGPAELFASALVGNKRAELIGERTLGRAGLQKLVTFADGSGLLLTWARYLTPAGKPIHGAGLEPADPVEEPDVEFGEAAPTRTPFSTRPSSTSRRRRRPSCSVPEPPHTQPATSGSGWPRRGGWGDRLVR